MSVCGFSFGKDLAVLDYPVEESVRSVLPLCDRFVFVVGRSSDDTRDRVAAIDPKIEILDSEWAELEADGKVFGIEANKALEAAQATGCTWGFYSQPDEVVHEDDLPLIHGAMDAWADDLEVKALLFRFLQFVQDYQTVDPWMFHKACRVVKLDRSCRIFGDGCGPGLIDYNGSINDGYLDKHHLGGHVRWARHRGGGRPARIFHYAWVKTPRQLDEKFRLVEKFWWGTLDEAERNKRMERKFGNFAERYPILKNFRGSHPAVMQQRIAAHPSLSMHRNRWLNPRFYREILKHGFQG